MANFLQKLLPFVGDIGNAAAASSAARAQGRLAEGNYDLDRASVGLRTRQAAINDALRGGLLQGVEDFTVTPPPGVRMGTITGGARPSAIVNRGEIGANLQRDAMARMLSPDAGLPEVPQPGKLDKFLNTFGSIAPIVSKLPGLFGKGAAAAPFSGAGSVINPGSLGGPPGAGGALGTAATGAAAFTAPLIAGTLAEKAMNRQKADRELFAKGQGFANLAAFNEYLSTLGPEGQALREFGENVVGKHDPENGAKWIDGVTKLLASKGVTAQAPKATPFGLFTRKR